MGKLLGDTFLRGPGRTVLWVAGISFVDKLLGEMFVASEHGKGARDVHLAANIARLYVIADALFGIWDKIVGLLGF